MYIFWCLAALCVLVTHDWSAGPPRRGGSSRSAPCSASRCSSARSRSGSSSPCSSPALRRRVRLAQGGCWRGVPLGVVVLMSVPWTIRNAMSLDAFVPTSTNTGDTLCLDRVDGADGGFRWSMHEGCADPVLPEVERNSISTRKAIGFVLEDPVRELLQIGRRARLHLRHRPRRRSRPHRLVGRASVVSDSTASTLGDVVGRLLPRRHGALAVAGLGVAVVRRPRATRDGARARRHGLAVAVPLLLWGSPRFHLPFSPLLAVLAGGRWLPASIGCAGDPSAPDAATAPGRSPAKADTSRVTAANSPRPCSHSKRDGQPASGNGRSLLHDADDDETDDDQQADRDEPGQPRPAEVHDEHGARRRRPGAPSRRRRAAPAATHPDARRRSSACASATGRSPVGEAGGGHGGGRRPAPVERRRGRSSRGRPSAEMTRAMVCGALRRPAHHARRPGSSLGGIRQPLKPPSTSCGGPRSTAVGRRRPGIVEALAEHEPAAVGAAVDVRRAAQPVLRP